MVIGHDTGGEEETEQQQAIRVHVYLLQCCSYSSFRGEEKMEALWSSAWWACMKSCTLWLSKPVSYNPVCPP